MRNPFIYKLAPYADCSNMKNLKKFYDKFWKNTQNTA